MLAKPIDTGVSHTNQLIVHYDDWPCVLQTLNDMGWDVTASDVVIKYDLVRVLLPVSFQQVVVDDDLRKSVRDACARRAHPAHTVGQMSVGGHATDAYGRPIFPRLGRNRLMGLARIERGSELVHGTPKLVGSLASENSRPDPVGDNVRLGLRRDLTSGNGVVVGVVDTDWIPHIYVNGAVLYRDVDLFTAGKHPHVGLATGHATFVAGLILQQAPGASVIAHKVMDSNGLAESIDVHDAICRLSELGADVINLSLGCVTADNEIPFVIDHALEWARRSFGGSTCTACGAPAPGIISPPQNAQDKLRLPPVVVAATGNHDGSTRKVWPAADPRVWSVAAARQQNKHWSVARFSGQGPWVDVAAPGDEVLSCFVDFEVPPGRETYAYWQGSSFATAAVSGLMASVLTGAARGVRARLLAVRPDGRSRDTSVLQGVGDKVTRVRINRWWRLKLRRVRVVATRDIQLKPPAAEG